MGTRQQIERYIQTLDPRVRDNVEIVSAQELKQDYLFHISKDGNIKKFTPQLSRRTAKKEDRTVPRICTATTLGGTVLAYQSIEHDYELTREKDHFKGGWYIYALPFELALRPKPAALYDVKATDEIWMVPYTEDLWSTTPIRVGKFFAKELIIRWEGNFRGVGVDVNLQVDEAIPLPINKKTTVSKGYWSFQMGDIARGSSLANLTVSPPVSLTAEEYRQGKQLHADLLSHHEIPPSGKW